MNNKNKKLANNTLLFLIGNIGSKFVQFLLVPLYTYTLTTEQYGTVDMIFATINFLIPIFSFQVTDGLLRFGLSKSVKKDDAISSSMRILLFGTFLSILSLPIIMMMPSFRDYALLFIIILNLQMYRDLLSVALKIKDLNKQYAINSIIYTGILCVLNILMLAIFKMGVVGYLLSYAIANALSIALIALSAHVKMKSLMKNTKRLKRQIFIYSLPLIVNSLSYWITMVSDRYMISAMLNVASVGIYAVACKIPSVITTFSGIFNQAWMISSIDEYENEKNNKYYSRTFDNYIGITMIVGGAVLLVLRPAMSIYVSPDFYEAWSYSAILIFASIFSGICAFINGIFYAYKKNINITITTVIGAVINIVLNMMLIPKIGVFGASVATLASWAIIAAARIVGIKKIIDFDINLKKLCASVLILLAEIAVLELLAITPALVCGSILVLLVIAVEKEPVSRIMGILKTKKRVFVKKVRERVRIRLDRKNRRKLVKGSFSIICSNCTAGVIYHNLGRKFTTPTINMYFSPSDFIKMCSNLRYYLGCDMIEKKTDLGYPVAMIGDVVAHGVHYETFEEMKNKWEERKKRVDYHNLYIMMTERDGCTYDDLLAFDSLNFDNKIVFTHKKYKDIKSSHFVKGSNNRNSINKTKPLTDYRGVFRLFRLLDNFDYVSWLNGENGTIDNAKRKELVK